MTKVYDRVFADRRLKVHERGKTIGISKDYMSHILRDILGLRKPCTNLWVFIPRANQLKNLTYVHIFTAKYLYLFNSIHYYVYNPQVLLVKVTAYKHRYDIDVQIWWTKWKLPILIPKHWSLLIYAATRSLTILLRGDNSKKPVVISYAVKIKGKKRKNSKNSKNTTIKVFCQSI